MVLGMLSLWASVKYLTVATLLSTQACAVSAL
uniref:Uncharacterized protein n=1 Tax=Anguilla anguilla TaxID=7936 RepID=A0A0E9PB50_ANGAN